MNYSLAKRLRDAGFPSHRDRMQCEYHGGTCWSDGVCGHSLEELIEACGDRLFSMTLHGSIWQINFIHGIGGEIAHESLIDAVAELWLKLNEGNAPGRKHGSIIEYQ